MYKVKYTKIAVMKDGTAGNISQGDDIAYVDCNINNIEEKLQEFLQDKKKPRQYFPTINVIQRIGGHLI